MKKKIFVSTQQNMFIKNIKVIRVDFLRKKVFC